MLEMSDERPPGIVTLWQFCEYDGGFGKYVPYALVRLQWVLVVYSRRPRGVAPRAPGVETVRGGEHRGSLLLTSLAWLRLNAHRRL